MYAGGLNFEALDAYAFYEFQLPNHPSISARKRLV